MKKSYLIEGCLFVLAGIAFFFAGAFTESAYDGLLWGFGGGAFGIGLGMVIKYFYWSSSENKERYQEIREQEEINLRDELNEKLRDKSGRIAYLIGLLVICISEVAFSILGKAGVITDYKIFVLYLFGLLVFQIVIGMAAFRYLRKKY